MKALYCYRACRLGRALRAYATAFEPTECLVDLLADARHWCDRHGHSYVELDRTAFRHYLEQVASAPRRKP